MGRDLSSLQIKDSYQYLLQKNSSDVNDGLGNDVDFLNISASYATTASYAESASFSQTSVSASHALVADVALNVPATASYALYAEVAGYATASLSASHALVADLATTASYATTADSAISSSVANKIYVSGSSEAALLPVILGSEGDVDTYTNTKVDGGGYLGYEANTSTLFSPYFNGDLQGNASTSTTASHALVADLATTASYIENAVSASYAVSSSHSDISDFAFTATSSSYATTATLALSSSHANNSDTAISASHALVADVALNVPATASYALYAEVAGFATSSLSASHALVSDLATTASYVENAVSASYAISSSYSTFSETAISASFATTASYVESVVSASYALTSTSASHANSSDTAISASYAVISDTSISSSYSTFSETSVSSSHAVNSDTAISASYASFATTASYALTASALENPLTLQEVLDAGNTATQDFILTGSAEITGSLRVIGDIDGSNNLVVEGGTNIGISSQNTMTGESGSGIFGGYGQNVSGNINTAFGGRNHTVSGAQGTNFAIGGEYHNVQGFRAGAVGGENMTVNGTNVIGIGGYANNVNGTYGVFGGGTGNNIGGTSYFAGGLVNSNGSGYIYAMLGGNGLECQTDSTFLGGGENNTTFSGHRKGAIIGGNNNEINGSDTDRAVILGGEYNTIQSGSSQNSAILGGQYNETLHSGSVILGGNAQTTTAHYQVVVPNLLITEKIMGSVSAEVNSIAIVSNTGSLDCSQGNFFTITLQNGVDTHLVASNIQAGQSVNIRITQNATSAGTISFSGDFAFEGGVPFAPTATTNAVDLMSFITYDTSTLYGTGINNFS